MLRIQWEPSTPWLWSFWNIKLKNVKRKGYNKWHGICKIIDQADTFITRQNYVIHNRTIHSSSLQYKNHYPGSAPNSKKALKTLEYSERNCTTWTGLRIMNIKVCYTYNIVENSKRKDVYFYLFFFFFHSTVSSKKCIVHNYWIIKNHSSYDDVFVFHSNIPVFKAHTPWE